MILHRGLHDFGLADLFHEVGHAAHLDELLADVFGKRGELLQLPGIAEEASQEVERLDVTL